MPRHQSRAQAARMATQGGSRRRLGQEPGVVQGAAVKVALVHDWFTGMRGGEYMFEAITEIFPRAELFTLLYIPGKISPTITTLKRHTSWLQKVPGVEKRYRHFLPLMPSMIESFD